VTRLAKVVPAILTEDPSDLETMARQAESFTAYVQFDIMDGRFVPSRSVTSEHIARLHTKLGWEAHLMVEGPEAYFKGFREAGARKAVFHFEATSSPETAVSAARTLSLKVGLAINPETPVAAVQRLVEKVDSVLLLTVQPGFYGSKFIPEVLDKIPQLRRLVPAMEIGVDGGIKESNIGHVARAGADVIYVGSAIFLQPQPGESYRRLAALAEEGSRQRQA